MIPRIHRQMLIAGLVTGIAMPLGAEETQGDVERLMAALQFGDVVEIMRDEGLDYADTLARDMLPGGATQAWTGAVATIYDADRMEATVRGHFVESFGDTETGGLIAFFTEGPGVEFIRLENSARRAMIDDGVEAAARDAARAAVAQPDARFAKIDAFVAANDLVEANVQGGMNASFQFYRGLAGGGALELGEDDILRDVWEQEAEMREDTREWVFAFLLMAYGPMSDEDLDAYIALSQTPEGRALNRALFAAFDRMYGDISYALGLAVARNMRTQEL